MQQIPALNPEAASGKTKDLFNIVQSKLGLVPNMMRTMGNSPAVLKGYLSLSEALGQGVLGNKLGELIAIYVANINSCSYCNAAHGFISEKLLGIDEQTIRLAREGKSLNPKVAAAFTFVNALVKRHGKVSAAEVQALRDAGYDEAGVAEIIGHVALNILTNYFNIAVDVEVDFPETALTEAAME